MRFEGVATEPSAVIAALAVEALLQTGGDVIEPWSRVMAAGGVTSAVSAFVATLVVGGLLVAIAPDYTERTVARVHEEPGECIVYGVVASIGFLLVAIALIVTIVGILVAIPLLFVVAVVGLVGSVLAYLAVGERLVGNESGWGGPLVLGAVVNAVLAFTSIGGLIGLVISAAGFGAVIRDWRSDEDEAVEPEVGDAVGAGTRGRR